MPPDFYARWRAQQEARLQLRERITGAAPPERVLQSVWNHQRLQRDKLVTTDGRPLKVLHPGFWNHESGPDFRGAVLQFGDEPPVTGDIEIDVAARNWQAHQHHTNPAFVGVILHIVWNGETPTAGRPMLALEPFLDAPAAELEGWSNAAVVTEWPEENRGACSAPLSNLPKDRSHGLLEQAALVRFQRKAAELETRARQAGWDHALWEGLFGALGYKYNTWPMRRVAELLPRLGEGNPDLRTWQARLLGVGGFLGHSHDSVADHAYLKNLWDIWWREREMFQDAVLPKAIWRMNGLRPANQPQRRLALAAHWVHSGDLPARLERWFTEGDEESASPLKLLPVLQPNEDPFWSLHWNFHSPRLSKPQPLLGEGRATDLAINVILPWFWVRARTGQNTRLAQLAEQRYLAWPPAEDNSILRLARQRLLGLPTPKALKTAASQQGLLQIVRDFCDHSNAVCANCTFPEMVRSLATA